PAVPAVPHRPPWPAMADPILALIRPDTELSTMSAAAESFSSPAPHRIAVFRASRPTSLLRSVPALRALREAYPEASITLVGIEESQGFEQRFHRYLDDFLVFPGATCNTRVPYAAGADNPGVVDPG